MNYFISAKRFPALSTIALTVLIALSAGVSASDLDKEKRWADQVIEAIFDGEPIWLNNSSDEGSHDFLGIYTPAEEDHNRAVIIMHGTGIHPDWQQVIQPLRVGLIEYNWNTLSIQMPVLANDAAYIDYAPLYDEVAPRIEAAIKYLKDNGNKEIVLIGHSQGSAMAAYYLATSKQSVAGFVAIGMAAFADEPRMDSLNALRKIHVPVLDLYGKEDLENIVASASKRTAAAKQAGNKKYTQLVIEGNHFFDGNEAALVDTVADWLDSISNL
jgi:pimeloyl-ACP methyl ester carboxylesterase